MLAAFGWTPGREKKITEDTLLFIQASIKVHEFNYGKKDTPQSCFTTLDVLLKQPFFILEELWKQLQTRYNLIFVEEKPAKRQIWGYSPKTQHLQQFTDFEAYQLVVHGLSLLFPAAMPLVLNPVEIRVTTFISFLEKKNKITSESFNNNFDVIHSPGFCNQVLDKLKYVYRKSRAFLLYNYCLMDIPRRFCDSYLRLYFEK